MRALRAFDAVVRHASFVRAAEELGIHQPSVSRYIAELEREIGVRLFERSRRAVTLTPAGAIFHRTVAIGLERIAAAALSASSLSGNERIVIACGGATSELFLRPLLKDVDRRLGENAVIRLQHCENSYLDRPNVMETDRIDLLASYHSIEGVPGDEVAVFREAIAPVCSPGFAAAHADTLRLPMAQWGALPFLSFVRPSLGWATWDDWFEAAGRPDPPPRYLDYDDYVYMIDAAIAGQGIALGWWNFVGRFIGIGSLVAVPDGFVEFERSFAVRLTGYGRHRPIARRCLDVFASLANGTEGLSAPGAGHAAPGLAEAR